MSDLKLFHQNIVLNIAQNRCKSAQTSPKMAVSGNADIFSIKVDSRLKTIQGV